MNQPAPTKQKKQPEFELQKSVCTWLDYQYPDVMYVSDTIASLKLTMPQQARNKAIQKKCFKCPDLMIFEPNNEFNGLFIELKTECPFKKDGDIKASQNDHLLGQLKTIDDLNDRGYYACFSWSLEMTIKIINNYMNNRP